jgi:hypothetical protein
VPDLTLGRPETPQLLAAEPPSVRPVMLLTFDVPFDRTAVAFAVESAAETGAELYVCEGIPVSSNPAVGGATRTFGTPEAPRRERRRGTGGPGARGADHADPVPPPAARARRPGGHARARHRAARFRLGPNADRPLELLVHREAPSEERALPRLDSRVASRPLAACKPETAPGECRFPAKEASRDGA